MACFVHIRSGLCKQILRGDVTARWSPFFIHDYKCTVTQWEMVYVHWTLVYVPLDAIMLFYCNTHKRETERSMAITSSTLSHISILYNNDLQPENPTGDKNNTWVWILSHDSMNGRAPYIQGRLWVHGGSNWQKDRDNFHSFPSSSEASLHHCW